MDADHEDLVAQFSAITGVNPSSAQATLESANWSLSEAVTLHYAAQEEGDDEEGDSYDQFMEGVQPSSAASNPAAVQASSSSAQRATTQRPKQMTLDDLKKMEESHAEDDEDDDRDQNLFAGGEKSGLAVQNPGQSNNGGGAIDHFRNIMNQARQNRDRPPPAGEEPQAPPRSSNFTGRAQTLGGDDVQSRVIEDPNQTSARAPPQERVSRVLHLWADGVSIDDGPLFRFDDPNNQNMMAQINQGRAPMALLNVRPDQEVDLSLDPHKNENYVAPKKKYTPFGGQGQRLGSPTPGLGSGASSSTATTAIPQSSGPTTGAAEQTPKVNVDESAPVIQLQIRLGDGTQLRSRFNATHTIGDVYSFVNSASTTSSQRPYALMTTFPSKELADKTTALGDMAEFKRGGVVVQKWK